MLPENRQSDFLYSIPKFDLTREDIVDFDHELEGFHQSFSDCFQRSEPRLHFYRYMAGQFSKIERKSIEPIALAIEGGRIRAMQRFVSDAPWDDDKIINTYHEMVNEDLGHPEGAIIFDESGFVKKGDSSVGVARQYCGSIGKVDNCQVGVFAAYTSVYGYALIDKRLYIPEQWFTDEYKERRTKCMLPDEVTFKTKPQLAAEMLTRIAQQGKLPFRYILADSVYGTSPDFINAAESLIDATYMVQVPKDTQCWVKRPMIIKKTYNYRGKPRTKKVLMPDGKQPVKVQVVAENTHDYFWYRRKVSEGAKGPIEYEFMKKRIVLAHEGQPTRTVWLFMRRTIEKEPVYSFYISNAPVSTRLEKFIWLSGLRWSIEQCFGEAKTELGMDQYEVRKFPSWHHHMLTCMLAHFFLWNLKIKLGKKSTCYYSFSA